MKRLALPAGLLFTLTACGGGPVVSMVNGGDISAVLGPATDYRNLDGGRVVPRNHEGASVRGGNTRHWTSPEGCTYSWTQAPGQEPVWYLVLNPHHTGKPAAHGGCPIRVMEQP